MLLRRRKNAMTANANAALGKANQEEVSRRAELGAQRFRQAGEIIALGEIEIGIGLFQALVDVGKHRDPG